MSGAFSRGLIKISEWNDRSKSGGSLSVLERGKGLSVCHTNQKGYKRNPEYMFSNYFRVFSRVERVYHAAI